MPIFKHISVATRQATLLLTLNRPEARNALHQETCVEMGRALDEFEADPALRVAVITGAGDRAFSAGFDLRYAEQHPEVYADPLFGSEIVRREVGHKPLIAAVNGVALGLGFELALACDLIIAADRARFGLPEVKVGLAAMGGGIVRLTREIGPKRALGLALTGELVSAAEGYRLGFVNEVVATDVVARALDWAAALARNAPLSLSATKQMCYQSLDATDLATLLDPRQFSRVQALLSSADAQEGRRAFLEQHDPVWKGR